MSSVCKPSICVCWFCGLCICALLAQTCLCIIGFYLHRVVTKGGNLLESVNRCVVTVLLAGMSGFVSMNRRGSVCVCVSGVLRLWVKRVFNLSWPKLTRSFVSLAKASIDGTRDFKKVLFLSFLFWPKTAP